MMKTDLLEYEINRKTCPKDRKRETVIFVKNKLLTQGRTRSSYLSSP